MQANRAQDTKPELAVRSALHRRGLRFFKHRVLTIEGVRTRPDIMFPKRRIVVFIDGCFWHRCPLHATDPKANSDYWGPKLDANVARDRRADETLSRHGWTVLRFWEHEDPQEVAEAVAHEVTCRGGRASA